MIACFLLSLLSFFCSFLPFCLSLSIPFFCQLISHLPITGIFAITALNSSALSVAIYGIKSATN